MTEPILNTLTQRSTRLEGGRMHRWRTLIVLTLTGIAALTVMCQRAPLPDTPENRRAAAQQYLDIVPLDPMISETVRELSKRVPELERDRFVKEMEQMLQPVALASIAIESMARHFTVAELEALARFNGSPEGKSVTKKFPLYATEVLPLIQTEILKTAGKIEWGRPGDNDSPSD